MMRPVAGTSLAIAAIFVLSWAEAAIGADTPKPLFASDEVINLTISGPITGISRAEAAKPVPGVLKVQGSAPETLPIALSTRGSSRKTPEICAFPPLRVEFTQKPGPTSLFKGQKRLKLVTHCQSFDKYQQDVFLEYAAYRLYQALTPESFNARLAKIDYTNQNGHPIITRYGFFLEDIDDVAQRNGQVRLRGASHIASSQIEPESGARFALFQYMISNLDWAMTASQAGEDNCCHNSRLIGAKGATTALINVPYDFDLSGLVDAPYAVPPAGIKVANVRVRRYRGFCAHNEQAQAVAADLAPRRASLLAILDETPQLGEGYRKRADAYLGDFFDEIASPAKVAEMLKTCLRPVGP
jgi:hypothetical protein